MGMIVNKLDDKLTKLFDLYLNDTKYDLIEIENTLFRLLNFDKNNPNYIVQYALVQLTEPILDYEKAYTYLSRTDDIRAILLRCYIQEWYYGIPPEINKLNLIGIIKHTNSKKEISCLCYYASFDAHELSDKVYLLKKSLQFYQYNLLSIISLQKIFLSNGGFNAKILFKDSLSLINRLNKTVLLQKQLLFKPFMYSKILGLVRTEENIISLEQMLFK